MPELTSKSLANEIERFQLDLEYLGFDLGRWGADGKVGSITKGAAHDAAMKFSLPNPTGDLFPAGLVDGLRKLVEDKKSDPIPKPSNFFDLTEMAWPGVREYRVPLSTWQGPLFHTTGCPMGKQSWDQERIFKRWADSSYVNKEGRTVRGSLKSHFGITQKGWILMVHPLEWFLWHAQQGSKICPGVEVESFDYGVPGDHTTLPGGGFDITPINDLQAQAAMDLTDWLDKILKRYTGKGIQIVHTHTQFTWDRDPDIGQTGYQKILIPVMKKYGITDGGPTFKKGSGRTIPKQWNPAYSRDYHDHS